MTLHQRWWLLGTCICLFTQVNAQTEQVSASATVTIPTEPMGAVVKMAAQNEKQHLSPRAKNDTVWPAQKQKLFSALVQASGIATTEGAIPFWMRANQYGSLPLSGVSSSLVGRAEKKYNTVRPHLFDWGFAVEGRVNAGREVNSILVEAFAKLKIGSFTLRGGRVKEMMGLADTSLTSGSFAVSGNALGVPKVEVSVPEFTHIFGGKVFAFKGNLAHGWLGDVLVNRLFVVNNKFITAPTYFHQKSLYGRIGKDTWKVRLYGGINHQVFWGNERLRFGGYYPLSQWETYKYVLEGRMYKGTSSKIGNHLGSIDLGFELNLKNTSVFLYRQNFYDVGGLYHLANIQDGLHGLSFTNKQTRGRTYWKKILVEYLYTKNQAGEPWSKATPTGAEDYYNNSEFLDGWSYKGLGLGTPFISTKSSTQKGFPSDPYEFFNNNRVSVLHIGAEGQLCDLLFRVKLSYSKNYGTWATSSYGRRTGGPSTNVTLPVHGVFGELGQFSSYLELSKQLQKGFALGAVLAIDRGDLLESAAGVEVKLSRSF